MTGNLLIDSLISIAGIVLMIVVARLAFPPPATLVTEEGARERLALDEPDFRPRRWLIDERGRAALAEGEDGDFVLVKRLGLDLAVRRFRPGAVKAAAENGALTIRLDDASLTKAVIEGGDAVQWAVKIAGESDI